MLTLIVWNRTDFDIETVFMLNWIVWTRIVLTFNWMWTKTILILNWIIWIRTVWQNWIAWNRNVFDNKTVYLHLKCVLLLNLIVWNGTIFDIETVLRLI